MKQVVTIALLVTGVSAAQAGTNDLSSLDRIHARIAHDIDHTVDYFDRFFGNDILNDDNRATHLTLRLGVRTDRREGAVLEEDFDLRLSIPQLRNRVQIIADNAIDVGSLDEPSAYENSIQGSKTDTGLRYIFTDSERLRINTDAGVQIGDPVRAFTKLRGRYTIPLDPLELRLIERLSYYTHEGFGADTEAELSRRYANGKLLRARAILEWRENQNGVTPRVTFSRFAAIDAKTSWRAALRGSWPETPHTDSAVYAHDITWRRLIHANWLFLEITPGIEWLERENYGWNPFIALTLEINFNADDTKK